MNIIKKLLLSKTIDCNAAYALILVALSSQGINVSPELATWGLAGLNIILRFITKEPLMEKETLF